MVPPHDPLQSEEALNAEWEAGKGGLIGAGKWGFGAAVLGGAAYFWSPVYRKTTIQFKLYLQLSAMLFGGMVEANKSLRQHEAHVRAQKRWLREKAKWDRYEQEVTKPNDK